jgi:hypothetical protein
MKTSIQDLLGLGLVTVINVLPAPAQADEVIWRKTETSVAPNVLLATPSSVTTTTIQTTPAVIETTPTNSILLAPTYMGATPMSDDTISRRTYIEGTRPAASSSETAIVSSSSSLDNKPRYGERIRLMRQQLEKGTANGWITADRSAALTSRLNDLQGRECSVRNAGFLKVDCDSFEKDLTGFNIELSHSMENHNM